MSNVTTPRTEKNDATEVNSMGCKPANPEPRVVRRRRLRLDSKVQVRCCGELHTIGLTMSGDLVFFNHSREEWRRWQGLAEIGGGCRCTEILEWWRAAVKEGKMDERLPRALQGRARSKFADATTRILKRTTLDWLTLRSPRPQHAAYQIGRLLVKKAALPPTTKIRLIAKLRVIPFDPTEAPVWEFFIALQLAGGKVYEFAIQAEWYKEIYKAGLSWVDDAVTLTRSPLDCNPVGDFETTQCRVTEKQGQTDLPLERNFVYPQEDGTWYIGSGEPFPNPRVLGHLQCCESRKYKDISLWADVENLFD